MGKIKINLVSGTTLEKPLISCFKGTNANYIVLDNESNGSMGLPIIIISKLNGTNLEKIIDPNEWGAVKENLRAIISGTALPYLAVPETLSAPDDFFTQLTLPVASYDLLKSVYAPPAEPAPAPVEPAPAPAPAAPAPEVPATPAVETPAEITLAPIPDATAPAAAPAEVTPAPAAPVEAPVQAPVEAPVVNPTPATPAPVETISASVDTPAPVVAPVQAPAVEAPAAAPAEVTPTPAAPVEAPVQTPTVEAVQTPAPATTPVAPAAETPAVDVASGQAPAIDLPQSQPAETGSSDADIDKIKETFMKSCENMFDALMKKFQNK